MGGFILLDPPRLEVAREAFATRFHTQEQKQDIQYKEMRSIL